MRSICVSSSRQDQESPLSGQFRRPPVDDDFLWWQTPVAIDALNVYARSTNDTQYAWVVDEVFALNKGRDHERFAPAWGDIENDEKNDDTLWWTLSALLSRNASHYDAAQRSFDHVRRFWADRKHCGCDGGMRWYVYMYMFYKSDCQGPLIHRILVGTISTVLPMVNSCLLPRYWHRMQSRPTSS